jgi:hypothetical protein
MAHVIAQSPRGPRGKSTAGDDSYENLILLCPTHHTMVDKAPRGTYSESQLLKWKSQHEGNIEESLRSPVFSDWKSLQGYVQTKLIENHVCWKTYGPEGSVAREKPSIGAATLWMFRKLSLIVPNNRRIIDAIRRNALLFSIGDYTVACEFIEHAEGFERRCIQPTEGIPRFPARFGDIFNG